jgi:hypothetical protein
MHEALRECAEQGVPDGVDLWPEVRERLFALSAAPVREAGLDVPLGQKQTIDSVSVILDRAYADASHVMIGYAVDGLGGGRHDDFMPRARLTDESGVRFERAAAGYGISWGSETPSIPEGSQAEVTLFEAPEGIEAPGRRRFRLEVEVFRLVPGAYGLGEEIPEESVAGPFVFDFEVLVRPVPIIEVNRVAEANGLSLALQRVENSPARTRAFICFDPPDEEHNWMPVARTGFFGKFFGQAQLADTPVTENACSAFTFEESLYERPGKHWLTVTEIVGISERATRRIPGPWRFRFEVPGP